MEKNMKNQSLASNSDDSTFVWQKRQAQLSPLLWPAGKVYSLIMSIRRFFWEQGIKSSYKPKKPVISIGNVAWGGTGKTPLVTWFLEWAKEQGLRPAVLSRGYKATPPTLPYLVQEESLAREVGDEPLLLARSALHAMVVVDPVRSRAARWLEEEGVPKEGIPKENVQEDGHAVTPDIFLLDDGLQHLAVARHMDLILMRPEDVTSQWNRVIPQGSWREGKSALKRASAFLFKMEPDDFLALAPTIEKRLARYEKPIFSFSLQAKHLERVGYQHRGVHMESPFVDDFGGAPYMLISGVGEPSQVRQTALNYFDYPPQEHRIFNDHHHFTLQDAQNLAREAAQKNLAMLCTPKDAVKLERVMIAPLWTFALETRFGPTLCAEHCQNLTFEEWWDVKWTELIGGM